MASLAVNGLNIAIVVNWVYFAIIWTNMSVFYSLLSFFSKIILKNSITAVIAPGADTASDIESLQEIGSDHTRLSNYWFNRTFHYLYSVCIVQFIQRFFSKLWNINIMIIPLSKIFTWYGYCLRKLLWYYDIHNWNTAYP